MNKSFVQSKQYRKNSGMLWLSELVMTFGYLVFVVTFLNEILVKLIENCFQNILRTIDRQLV